MPHSIILFASSRPFGNSRKIAEYLKSNTGADFLDINHLDISYYDYEHRNRNDQFIPTFENIIKYDTLIFVTPVYWYSMCAPMKTFFDRMSDLVTIRKDLGRRLAGKKMAALCCASDEEEYPGFFMPFERSADYLDMTYLGNLHTWVDNENIPDIVKIGIDRFAARINSGKKQIWNNGIPEPKKKL
jgi:multimeric flavodoxin WrbA